MSQAQIGNLNVMLGINTAQFAAGLASAQGSLGTFGESLKKFAALAAGAFSFGAMTAAVKSSIDQMDELSKAAQKIGIPVDDLSKLEYAGKLADVSLEDLTGTLAKFSKNIAEVGAGGKNDAGKALQALGISATDAQGQLRPTTDIMADIADEFSVMQDGAGKTALAIALFGKSGAEMIPLLNGGRDALAEAAAEAEKYGVVVSEDAGAAAENFNDNLTRLSEVMSGIVQRITTGMLPSMVELTNTMVQLSQDGSLVEDIIKAVNFIINDFNKALVFLNEAMAELTINLEFAAKAFELIKNGDFSGMMDAWQERTDKVNAALQAMNDQLDELNGKTQTVNEAAKTDFKGQTDKKPAPFMPPSGSTSGSPKTAKPQSLDAIYGKGFTSGVEEAQKSLDQLFEEMQNGDPTVKALNDGFKEMADTLVSDLSNAVVGLIDGTMTLQDAFSSMAQSIVKQLEELAAQIIKSQILKVLAYMGTSIGGAQGFMGFGGLYADGGTLGSGKWGIAGEAGPEIIHGPATITPMDKIGGGSGASIQINNYVSNASVQARQQPDGRITVDFVEKELASRLARGGSPLSAGLEKGYGLRRAGR